jgi:hypothetical protein
MAERMPDDWNPPSRARRHGPTRTPTGPAPWAQWADGGWWRLVRGVDLPVDADLRATGTAAFMWAACYGLQCSRYIDSKTGALHVRFTIPSTTAGEEAA